MPPEAEAQRRLSFVVELEGCIGSGKSTLSKKLKQAEKEKTGNDVVIMEEHVNETFLGAFYKEVQRFAFSFQMYMLTTRLHQMDVAATTPGTILLDRGVIGDAIFALMHKASGNISSDEWAIYSSVCKQRQPQKLSDRVNVLVYLDVEPATCLARISERARGSEEKIPLGYLETLDAAYFSLLLKWMGNALDDDSLNLASPPPPIVVLPWDTYGNTDDVLALIESVRLGTYTTPSVSFVAKAPESTDYATQTDIERDYRTPIASFHPTSTSVSMDWKLTSSNAARRLVFRLLAHGVSLTFWGSGGTGP